MAGWRGCRCEKRWDWVVKAVGKSTELEKLSPQSALECIWLTHPNTACETGKNWGKKNLLDARWNNFPCENRKRKRDLGARNRRRTQKELTRKPATNIQRHQ
jgi:hypothetical protein